MHFDSEEVNTVSADIVHTDCDMYTLLISDVLEDSFVELLY